MIKSTTVDAIMSANTNYVTRCTVIRQNTTELKQEIDQLNQSADQLKQRADQLKTRVNHLEHGQEQLQRELNKINDLIMLVKNE